MRTIFITCLVGLLCFLTVSQAQSAVPERVALIIGNSEYEEPKGAALDSVYLPRIDSPAADIELMERTLKVAGFQCTTFANLTTARLKAAMRDFAARYKGARVVLFYYSGHGIAQDGVNYLAGVDARIDVSEGLKDLERARDSGALSAEGLAASISDLKRRKSAEQLAPLEDLLRELASMSVAKGNRKIVLLDACRDPLAVSAREQRPLASKGSALIGKGSSGLTKPSERPGMFIGFAAAAGQFSIAFPNVPGAKPHPSLFTRAFCEEAFKPGVALRDAFDAAGVTVDEESGKLLDEQRAEAPLEAANSQEAQTPAAYSIVFPPGFAFVAGSIAAAPDLPPFSHAATPPATPMPGTEQTRLETPRPVIPQITKAVSGRAGTPVGATQAAPFVNTLWMKFVPVEITGGPTNGQRVLFSVWDTQVRDYAEFVKATNWEWKKPYFEQGQTHPAVNVSWDDAKAFCEWLTQKERASGKIGPVDAYRLPSDHEWSCAVGIGDREDPNATPESKDGKLPGYPWGTQWPPPNGAGNFADETAKKAQRGFESYYIWSYDDGYAFTSPVGSYKSNREGLYDMSGNVWQWCEDWYSANQHFQVLRGGSWYNNNEAHMRSSGRFCALPATRNVSFGFRCVLVVSGG